MNPRFLLPLASLLCFSAGSAQAVVLIADFNDLNVAAINGQGGGTGFTGNWSGSAVGQISGLDLSSSLYNVPQPATDPRSFQGPNNGAVRQNYRTVASSPTGEVWFSFLARTRTTPTGLSFESAGISLNAPTASPFDDRGDFYVQFTGNDLFYSFGAGTAGSSLAQTTSGATALVVGRVVISGGGANDTVALWVNPDLIANPNIFDYSPVYSSSAFNAIDTISRLGVIGYQTGTQGGGVVDNVRFSDGGGSASQAYLDVTGVPEPSVFAFSGIALGGLFIRRKRPQA